jgi:multiple sugar transport system substrate-binding protein
VSARAARRRSRIAGAVAGTVMASALAACGGGDDGGSTPTLIWYVNPDNGGQVEIAKRCTEAAAGRYVVDTADLPRDASEQREQLVRRLAAEDDSIDIMSLDPPFVPEFAQAGFLAPVPPEVEQRVSKGVVQSALEGASWDGKLVSIPFWANTQLLWYRKSVAEAAGLDMTKPVTWDQLIKAAQDQGKIVSAQGIRSESLTVWLNALIESAGGHIITGGATDPNAVELGLTAEPGVRAAEVMHDVATSGVVGPTFSTANENTNADEFESPDGGFMVNWPFVWPKANTGVADGVLDASVPKDYGWTLYPRVDADKPSAPPMGGIDLAVGAFGTHPDLAYEATECISSDENQSYYFISNGNPAASAAVFDDPAVIKEFPMAPVIRESLEMAAPRPQSAYYSEITGAIQREYHSPDTVDPGSTPQQADELIKAVLRGDKLL